MGLKNFGWQFSTIRGLRSQRRSKVLFFFFFDPLGPHLIKKKSEKFEKSTTLHPMLYASSSKTLAGKKNCISGHWIVFTDIMGSLTAKFFIYNKAVNNLLETVTLRPLFRWIPNVVGLFLATRRNFFALKNCEKWWCFSMLSKKQFPQWKLQNIYPWDVSYSARLDGATSNLT